MRLAKINKEQGLYVLHESGGYSCLGFEVAERKLRAVAAWAKYELPDDYPELGTAEHHELYERVMAAGSKYSLDTRQRCDYDLEPLLKGLEGQRVEVLDASGQIRRFWVGKSCGWFPIHLELSRRDSTGGPAVCGPIQHVTKIQTRSR